MKHDPTELGERADDRGGRFYLLQHPATFVVTIQTLENAHESGIAKVAVVCDNLPDQLFVTCLCHNTLLCKNGRQAPVARTCRVNG